MSPTLFTRIVNGEVPCHKICEDNDYLAFLDIRPINPGHSLVIPKKEINYFFDLDDQLLGGIMVFAKRVAAAIRKEVECKRIGVMIAGIEVPHAHVHLVPIQELGDLNFARAKPADEKGLARIAARIRSHL
jgi:histidine triad (HIT) family protein